MSDLDIPIRPRDLLLDRLRDTTAVERPPIVRDLDQLRQRSITLPHGSDVAPLVAALTAAVVAYNGRGLAAIQLGQAVRMFVVRNERGVYAFVNPVITWRSDKKTKQFEGCLSLPGISRTVRRPAEVKLRTFDPAWKVCEMHVGGALARVIQHEMDHLDGVLIVDRSKSLNARAA